MNLFHRDPKPAGPAAAPSFSAPEAVTALLFLVVTADGSIAREEEELVIAASNRMKLLRGQSIDEFNGMVQKIRDAIDACGREPVFTAALEGVPADLRETIYTLCTDVAYAERPLDSQESALLERIREALQIPADLAAKILEVINIKNRG